jgi:hypothetical protein
VIQAFQNDFLMTQFLDVELVEVVDGDVEESAPSDVVVDEVVSVRVDGVVEAWKSI